MLKMEGKTKWDIWLKGGINFVFKETSVRIIQLLDTNGSQLSEVSEENQKTQSISKWNTFLIYILIGKGKECSFQSQTEKSYQNPELHQPGEEQLWWRITEEASDRDMSDCARCWTWSRGLCQEWTRVTR